MYRKLLFEYPPPRDRPSVFGTVSITKILKHRPPQFPPDIDHAMSDRNHINRAIYGIGACDKHVCRGVPHFYRTVARESGVSAICGIRSRDMLIRSRFPRFCL
ncbi:unnamed protein product [Ixodes pacificus]